MATSEESEEGATVRERPGGEGEEESSDVEEDSTQTSGQVDELYGQEFAGRYHVGETLGKGGYGRVYRAKEVELERDVALKVLESDREEYSEKTRKRFLREAKLVAGLQEHHTIKLYDYGEADGYLYLAFEYVDGQTLGKYVSENGALKPFELAKLLEQILDSLHEAHEQGVLHRDIKPGNIMVYEHERRGLEVKVLDFGIGKMLEREDREVADLTAEGTMMGTPRYMSPEQMRGDELGPPTDLWSLGVVALEALTGERVIKSSRALEVTSCILEPGPEPFRVPAAVDVPAFFRQLIEKLLQKSVSERYQTTSEVLEDLAELRQRERPPVEESPADGVEEPNGEEQPELEAASREDEKDGTGSGGEEAVNPRKAEAETARVVEAEGSEEKTAKQETRSGNQLGVRHLVVGVSVLALGGFGVWFFGSSEADVNPGTRKTGGAERSEPAGAEALPSESPAVLRKDKKAEERADGGSREETKATARKRAEGVIASGTAAVQAVQAAQGEEGESEPASGSSGAQRRTTTEKRETENQTKIKRRARKPGSPKKSGQNRGAAGDGVDRGDEQTEQKRDDLEGTESSEGTKTEERMKVWGVE